jgi:hypothetical protein
VSGRLIRDSQESPDPRTALLTTKAAVAAARVRLDALQAPGARVIGTLPREPLMAGDPASSSGVLVDMSELAGDVKAAIAAGGGSGTDPFISADFVFSSPTPLDFGVLNAGDEIVSADVIIETAFDDPGAILTLGRATSTGSILTSADIDPNTVGTYNSLSGARVGGPDAIRLQLVPLASTQGAGRVVVVVRRAT